MHLLHTCPRVLHVLQRFDFVGLVHTGTDGEDTILHGFRCIRAVQRPGSNDSAKSGGIAIFVKSHLWGRVCVARERAALGMIWIKVNQLDGTATYVCLCYMPHQNSTYFRSTEGLDVQTHWDSLSEDVAEFSRSGNILIMGDFNARTGSQPEFDARELAEWEQMAAHTDVAAPPQVGQLRQLCTNLPQRRSKDRVTNAMGKRVLELCRTYGLTILNGRLPGDEEGAWTFYGPGGSRSVIDYMICSPGLAFSATGNVMRGCHMHTWDYSTLPARPAVDGEGKFDHSPVGVRLRVSGSRAPQEAVRAPRAEPKASVRWVWRKGLYGPYLSALAGHDVMQMFEAAKQQRDAARALELFSEGMYTAVGRLHAECGRVFATSGSTKRCGRPVNLWYDDACRAARDHSNAMATQHGCGSTEAKQALRAYRLQIRKSKFQHMEQCRSEMVSLMYEDPRQFWRQYTLKDNNDAERCCGIQEWADYFSSLLASIQAAEYIGGTVEAHCAAFADLFPQPSTAATAAAECLNLPFTEVEVQQGLSRLACHRAAGVDGMTAEFLQQAFVQGRDERGRPCRYYVLGPAITHIFNSVLRGQWPEAWSTSALIPVPKPKGRPDRKDDHRGIAVSPVIAKLFAIVMLSRMDRWAEKGGLRATGQAGFRASRGSVDNCLVLRHMIDAAAVRHKPLYCCFIDFSKAYDRVDRALLWRCLQSCGLHGHALHTLMGMYEDVSLQVRVGGRLSDPFPSTLGVRQGCPLSPLQFGIFIDRLEKFLEAHCPEAGVPLGTAIVRALMYADDVAIMASTPEQLRSLLSGLERFCAANGMVINLGKSEVVVFNSEWHVGAVERLSFSYNGATLTVSKSYVYLGLTFEDGKPMKDALDRSITKARKALFALYSQCHKLGMHNVDVKCHLFDSLVKSVLCYGCEVWGPDWVSKQCQKGNFGSGEAEEKLQKPFLRQTLGVCKSTPDAAMYRELNRQPFCVHWIRMATQLWNKALKRDAHDFLRLAVEADVELCRSTERVADKRRLWAFHLTTCWDALGIEWHDAVGNLRCVDPNTVASSMLSRWRRWEWKDIEDMGQHSWAQQAAVVRGAPESFSKGFKLLTYMQWFASEPWTRYEHWSYHLDRADHIRVMAQFRLGSHWLNIQQGRCRKPKLPRGRRVCPSCASKVEDELHILECPLYDSIRARSGIDWQGCGSDTADDMVKQAFHFNTKTEWIKFADMLMRCRHLRTDGV